MGADFAALAGVGVVVCLATLVFAFLRSGEPKDPEEDWVWWDSWNIGAHWRGWLKLGGAMIAVGLVAQVVVAVAH